MTDTQIYGIWGAMVRRTLSPKGREALDVYPTAQELYEDRYSASMLLGRKDAPKLLGFDPEKARNIAEICEHNGIRIYLSESDEFPQRLLDCEEPPELVFSFGSAEMALNAHTIAVVGSRTCDAYSESVTRRISADLARAGITVISGFARGIDTAAHKGALDAGGSTVAFLGSGLLYDYPNNTMDLKRMISNRGAVITEYLPNEICLPNYFLSRNRLIAGCSEAVLCTQASIRSGSLSTVRHALAQGKPVFVTPPHDIYDETYGGIISLLRDGAVQVYSSKDIIDAMM